MQQTTCGNCGRVIGKLETPHIWRSHTVCYECHGRLSELAEKTGAVEPAPRTQITALPPTVTPPAPPVVPPPAVRTPPPIPPRVEVVAPLIQRMCVSCGLPLPEEMQFSADPRQTCPACELAVAKRVVRKPQRTRNSWKNAVLIGVWLLGLGTIAVAIFMAIRRPVRPNVQVVVQDEDPMATVESQVKRLMWEADQHESGGKRLQAAGKYMTVREFLKSVDPDPRFEPYLNVVSQKLRVLLPSTRNVKMYTYASGRRSIFDAGVSDGTFIEQPAAHTPVAYIEPESKPVTSTPRTTPRPSVTITPTPTPTPTVTVAPAPATNPTAVAVTPAPGVNPQPPAPAAKPAAPLTPVEEQIARGTKELVAGQKDAADSGYRGALAMEPKNPRGFHGRGLVSLLRGNATEAAQFMETALRYSATSPPPRTLIHNLACAHLKTNPMRSAKHVKDYLSMPGVPVDEVMANNLAAALNMADYSARRNPFYEEIRSFYLQYDKKLAADRRDGMARWGTEWVSADVAARKWGIYRENAERLAAMEVQVGRATIQKKKAYDDMRFMQRDLRLYSTAEKAAARDKYNAAAENEIRLREQLRAMETQMAATELPPLPTTIEPILDP